ncbi:MAG: hypothetical protein H6619_05970 [Deltaproteobacteria bacterium]|nr:hypothetical protein [Deltaproteobacteria bacterium]
MNASQLQALRNKKSPFELESWEVIGELRENHTFEASGFEVVSREEVQSDDLYDDFGGRHKSEKGVLWHAPQGKKPRTLMDKKELEAIDGKRISMREEELKALIEEAEKRGKQDAFVEAKEGFVMQLANMNDSLAKMIEGLVKQNEMALQELERKAVDLSVHIAKKLIDGAVEINPEYIVQIIREALQLTGSAIIKSVRVSPQDMEFIDVIGIAKQLKEYDGSWNFVSDENVSSGCVVETTAGQIDFQLDKAWERIANSVVEVVRER